jgi:hypothetical protein
MKTVIVLVACLSLVANRAAAATQEQIGSWVLNCAKSEPCLLRAEKRFFDKTGITGELEVLAEGTSLVPVIALRGLPTELLMAAALAGKAEASMQFGAGPREPLVCAPSAAAYICSPPDDAVRTFAAALPTARSLTVRLSVTVPGLRPLPVQQKSLDLSGTAEALARLRMAGPTQLPNPITALASPSPGAFMGMADKALKAAGYPNGVADLQTLVAKYRGK